MTVGTRMRVFRESIGLTRDQFGEKYGISPSTLAGYELNKREPHVDGLTAFVTAGVDANWLITGKGSMTPSFGNPVSVLSVNEPAASYGPAQIDSDLLQQVIDFFLRWVADNSNDVRINRARWGAVIAVLYRLAAQAGKVDEPELVHVLKLAA